MLECRNRLRRRLLGLLAAAAAAPLVPASAAGKRPVLLGLDAEFDLLHSTSAQAIAFGMRTAIDEINRAGGVLDGRPLELVTKDHRSIPARGVRNLIEFAAMPDLVAVFGGRFSPVVIEQLPLIDKLRIPFMAVWSSADAIVDNGMHPNHVFRLSLRDSLAMPALLDSARERGLHKVGLLLTNTSWGRSNRAAAERYGVQHRVPRIVGLAWHHWTERTMLDKYLKLLNAGAQAVILVAIDEEAAVLVREVAALAPDQRVPILSHWGIAGSTFPELAGPALQEVDLTVLQTFSFFRTDPAALARFMQTAERISAGQVRRIEDIAAPSGVAHAYDATHILARAIDLAGSAERAEVRSALEKVRDHRGLVKYYAAPFTPERHEALGPDELLMTRYRADGVLVPVE